MIYESEISIFNKDALKTKFGSIQTNFDVTLGKISAIISDSEIEEYISGHTTMNSKLSSVVQDLDGVHTQVSSMKTDYDSHFTSVESHLTTLDTTVSGISASVSTVSQEAIKTDTIYYLATSASSGVTRSTSGWTTTTQSVTAEKRYLWIYHKYTKGDDSTTYTDPVIAGVYGDTGADSGNMLLDTYARDNRKVNAKYDRYFSDASNTSTTASFVSAGNEVLPDPNAKYFVRIKNTVVYNSSATDKGLKALTFYNSGDYVNGIGMVVGDTYRASCWVRQLEGGSNFTIGLGVFVNNVNFSDLAFVPTPEWQKYEKVFTLTDFKSTSTTVWSRLYFENLAGYGINGAGSGIGQIDMCGFKLERINAITASGRNLCLRSSDYNGWGKNNGTTFDGNIINFPTVTANTWREAWQNNNVPYSTVRNQKVTVTYKVKGTSGDLIQSFVCLSLVATATDSSRLKYVNKYGTLTANGEWQTVAFSAYVNDYVFSSGTGTPDYDNCYFMIRVGASGAADGRNGFQMKEIMVALGSDPCAWSPAPEDGIAYTDAVEVGGRNLILESKNLSLFSKESSITVTRTDSDCTVTNTSSGTSHFGIYYDVPVVSDSEYVLSAVFANVSGTCTWSIGDTSSGTSRSDRTGICPYTNISNGNLSEVIKIPNDCDKIRIYFSTRGNGSKFTVSNVQLEKGNKATAWTPAPEDVSIAEIATLRYASNSTTAPSAPTSAVTSTATTTGVWTKATPILSGTYKYMYMCDQIKWETGKYTWTAVVRDSALEDLVERVTTAELKITDSAIISTVTETVNGKTALNSVIDQRADSIRLKADKISWSSTYSSMTENGTLTASNVKLTGKITATSGYIGTSSSGFTISSSAIYNGISSVGATSGTGVYLGTDGINLGGGKFKVTTAGAVTAKSLTANDYLYVDGNSSSFFKIQLYPFDGNHYFQISNGGLKIINYAYNSPTTSYYDTEITFGSTSGNRSTPLAIKESSLGYTCELNGHRIRFDAGPVSSSSSNHIEGLYSYNEIWMFKSVSEYTQIKPTSIYTTGTISCLGTKNRVVSTDDYSDRLLYCYETPSPMFGDVGEGEIGEDGKCYVWLDPIFSQTIRTSNYQVSLQSYSPSLTYVMERTGSYFVVGGEPGAKFGWEIKAKQADFAERRLDRFEEQREDDSVNYGLLASNHINELMEGRYAE